MTDFAVASATAAAWIGLSLLIGERFPLSRYTMYARSGLRSEGAVLFVRCDGRELPARQVVDWHGVDPAAISADGYPCSQTWAVVHARDWVAAHSSPTPGPSTVEVGFRILRVGAPTTEVILARGTGRAC